MIDICELPSLNTDCVNDSRGINVQIIETYCRKMYKTYQCTTSRFKVILRTLTMTSEFSQLRLPIARPVDIQMKDKIVQMVASEYDNTEQAIRTLAIGKIMSHKKVAEASNKALFELDAIFFNDCYVVFRQRSIPIDFVCYNREQLKKQIRKTIDTMHSLKFVHLNISEKNIFYSSQLNHPVLSNFSISWSIIEDLSESTKMKKYPGQGTYQCQQLKQLKQLIDNRDLKARRVREKSINLYLNDKSAFTEACKKIENTFNSANQANDYRPIDAKYSSKIKCSQIQDLPDLLRQCFIYSSAFAKSFLELNLIIERYKPRSGEAFLIGLYDKLKNLYEQQLRTEDSLNLCNYLIEVKGNKLEMNIKRIQLQLQLGRIHQAEKLVQQIPNKYLIKLELKARLKIAKRQPEQALQLLKKIISGIRNHPRNVSISTHALMGQAYMDLYNYQNAAICFQRCLDIIKESSSQNKSQQYRKILKVQQFKIRINIEIIRLEQSSLELSHCFEELISDIKDSCGKYNSILLIPFYNSAINYIKQSNYTKAAEYINFCSILLKDKTNQDKLRYGLAVMKKQISYFTHKEDDIDIPVSSQVENQMIQEAATLIIHDKNAEGLLKKILQNSSQVSFKQNIQYRKRLAISLLDLNMSSVAKEQIDKAVVFFNYNIKSDIMDYERQLLFLTDLLISLTINEDPTNQFQKLKNLYQRTSKSLFKSLHGLVCIACGLASQTSQQLQSLDYFEEAVRVYHQVCPNQTELIDFLKDQISRLCYKMGMFGKVRQIYSQAVRKDAFKPKIFLILADIDFNEGLYKEGIQNYKRYIRSSSTSNEPQKHISKVDWKIAECFRKTGDLESALEYYHKAENLKQPEIYLEIASIYEIRKLYEIAFQYYLKIQYKNNPGLCKKIAKLCTKLPALNDKISIFLSEYTKYLQQSKKAPKVDPDVYEITAHSNSIPPKRKIKILKKYLDIVGQNHQKREANSQQQDQSKLINFPRAKDEISAVRIMLADLNFSMDKYQQALQQYKELYYGPKKTAVIYNLLQCSVKLQIQDEQLYRDAFLLYERLKGSKHPQTLSLIRTIGTYMFKKKRYLEAYIYCSRCIEFPIFDNHRKLVDMVYQCIQKLCADSQDHTNASIAEAVNWAQPKLDKLNNIKIFLALLEDSHDKQLQENFFLECYLIDPVPHEFCKRHTTMIPELFTST